MFGSIQTTFMIISGMIILRQLEIFHFLKQKDYILGLDADDVLFEKNQQKFLKLKQKINPDIDAISMFYHLGLSLDDNPLYIAIRHRLVKRSRNFQWTNKVLEVIQVKGNTAHSDIVITHCKERSRIGQNFKILQSIVEAGEATDIDRFNYANECMIRKEYEEAIQ